MVIAYKIFFFPVVLLGGVAETYYTLIRSLTNPYCSSLPHSCAVKILIRALIRFEFFS